MLDTPQIVHTGAHLTATIRFTIPREEIRNVMGPGISEFGAWITAEGHTPAPNLWECYIAGPESSSDPATWRTELNRPLTRQAPAARS